ncbi:MAG: ATP-binding protein [Saprospiraceae bacterium]|nr:ATP-binding protein [Saprospiraceae bacterium]
MKIVCTGPECSGKSTLSKAISKRFQKAWVREMARPYLDLRNNEYDKNSLFEIARLQLWEEKTMLLTNNGIVCDTDLLTLIIWSREKYGYCDPWMMDHWENSHVDIYFLCKPDMPWVFDPQRTHPNDRERLFLEHQNLLDTFKKPYYIIEGELHKRLDKVNIVLNG